MVMRKLAILVLAFAFAGIGFPQQTHKTPDPEGFKRFMEWCEQNWEQCKKRRLRMLSVEKECLEKSQNFGAFRECMFQFREEWRKDQP
jgi:hypothetical protein